MRRVSTALTMELEAVTLPVLDTDDVSVDVCVAVTDALAVTDAVCREGARATSEAASDDW
jgi:hypothetical protein